MYDIIVLVDHFRRSNSIAQLLIQRGLPVTTLATTAHWKKDLAAAQALSKTTHFFLVDTRYWIYSRFTFNYRVPSYDASYVHLFQVNGDNSALDTIPNYGGVRLYPRVTHDSKWLQDYVHDTSAFGGLKFVNEVCGEPLERDTIPIYQLVTDEYTAYDNYAELSAVYPIATSVVGKGSIHASHAAIARDCPLQRFVVVDADFRITGKFLDSLKLTSPSLVNVWYARNPINGLVYGHGAPKLFHKFLFNSTKLHGVDMTFSLTQSVKVIEQEVGVHAFNFSAFSTWRTAFREAFKLTQSEHDIDKERLDVWLTKADRDASYWDYCLRGAREGHAAAKDVNFNRHTINNYQWLRSEFTRGERSS